MNTRAFALVARSGLVTALLTLTALIPTASALAADACVTAPTGLVGWWRAESNAVDVINGNNGGLVNGAGYAPGEVGQAFAFNTLNQAVIISNAPALNPTNGFTLEAWVYVAQYPANDGVVVAGKDAPWSTRQYLVALNWAGNRWSFRPHVTVAGGLRYFDGGVAVQTNTWYHVVMTHDNATLRLYVNGAADGSLAATGPAVVTANPLVVGGFGEAPWTLTGRVDELGLYNRALSSAEVLGIYGAGSAGKCVPPPCAPPPSGLVSWWRAENNALDSADGNHGTLAGQATYGPGRIGRAFVFDGNRDGVAVGTGTNLQLQNFTIEAWIKRSSATQASFDGNGNGELFVVGTNPGGFGLRIEQANNQLVLGKSGGAQVTSAAQVADTNWHHVAVTKQGTTVVFYVDGVPYSAPAYDPGLFTFSAPAYIGAWFNNFGQVDNNFYGAIDELAVYNRGLSATEIQGIFGAEAQGKCVPPNCTAVPPGALAWWRGENDTLDAIGSASGMPFGGLAYANGKVQRSFLFDGINDAVTNAIGGFKQATNSFSMEFWARPTAARTTTPETTEGIYGTSGQRYAIYPDFGDLGPVGAGVSVGTNGVSVFEHGYAYLSSLLVFDTPIQDWTHIAVVYENRQPRLYLNGVLVRTGLVSTRVPYPSAFLGELGVGTGNYGHYRGQLDEVTLYGRPLTPAEVAAIYAASAAGKCASGVTNPPPPVSGCFSAAADFSTNSNPNGVWSYGYSPTLGGALRLFAERGAESGVIFWRSNIWIGAPVVARNPAAVQITNGTTRFAPGQLAFHPGPNGEFAVIRFTCPSNGVYQLTSAFRGIDVQGTTTDVHVLRNGTPTLSGLVNGFGAATGPSFTTNLVLAAGDRVEFAVGRGANNEFSFDTTAIEATLCWQTNAPPPPAPPCTTSPAGLVSWWRGQNNAADSADANPGLGLNGLGYAAGRVGQAFNFDGVNDLVVISNRPNLNPAGSFSIEGWILPRQDRQQMILGKWGDDGAYANNRSYALHTSPSGRGLQFAISDFDHQWDGAFHLFRVDGVLTLNAWNHVAATYDQAAGIRRLYVNGVLVGQRTNAPVSVYAGIAPVSLGAQLRAPAWIESHLDGLLDEISFYDRNLSPADVAALFGAGSSGRCQTPPAIVTHPASQKVTVGSNVTFSVVAEGTPQLRYQWRRATTNLAGATSNSLSFVVAPNTVGPYSVRITNAFGAVISSNAFLTLNFRPEAHAQTLTTPEEQPLNLTLTGSDANGDPLTFQIVTPPAHGLITGTGANRTYTPAADYAGPDSFTFKANDGLADSFPATVSLVITPVNDAPVAQAQTVVTDEDTPLAITLGANDADGDPLTYTVTPPTNGTLSGTAPLLVYTPHTNYHGPDTFTFSVSDGQTNSNIATVSLTVRPVNDAPIARIAVAPLTQVLGLTNQIVIAAVCGDATVTLDGSGSSDVENDPLTYAWWSGTNALGSAAIVTNQFALGTHEIMLVVNDGALDGTATSVIEVISPAQSVGLLIAALDEWDPGRRTTRPLLATLRAANMSFETCHATPGVKQLAAFQRQVRAQIAPVDAALAERLIEAAQLIIDAVVPGPPALMPLNRIQNQTTD